MIEDKEKLIGERVQVKTGRYMGMYGEVLRVWNDHYIDVKSELDPRVKSTVEIKDVRFLNRKLNKLINNNKPKTEAAIEEHKEQEEHEGKELERKLNEMRIVKTNFFPKLCGIPSGSYPAYLRRAKIADDVKEKINNGFKKLEDMCLEDRIDMRYVNPEQESEDKEEEVEEMKEQVEDISFKEKVEEARLEKESNNMNLLNRALKKELGLQKWIELIEIAKKDYQVIMDAFNS